MPTDTPAKSVRQLTQFRQGNAVDLTQRECNITFMAVGKIGNQLAVNPLISELKVECIDKLSNACHRLNIGLTQRGGVLNGDLNSSCKVIPMQVVIKFIGKVGALFDFRYKSVIEPHALHKTHCLGVTDDDLLPQNRIRNLAQPVDACAVYGEWMFGCRDNIAKKMAGLQTKEQGAISGVEPRHDDRHFVIQAAKQLLNSSLFSRSRLPYGTSLLPVRHPYCDSYCNYGANRLYPGGGIGTRPRNNAKAVAACKGKQAERSKLKKCFHKFPSGYWQHINMTSLWRAA